MAQQVAGTLLCQSEFMQQEKGRAGCLQRGSPTGEGWECSPSAVSYLVHLCNDWIKTHLCAIYN